MLSEIRHRWVVLALLVAGVLGGSCGGGTELTNTAVSPNQTATPTSEAIDTDTPPTPSSEPTAATDPTATPASVAPATGSGSIDAPLQLEGATLVFEPPSSDARWMVRLLGMVEAAPAEFNDADGECFIIVGVMTPAALEEGTISRSYASPDFGLIVDGNLVDSEAGDCATDDVQELGYRWLFGTSLTVGTDYPFYAEVFVEGSNPSKPEVVVVGELPGEEIFYYEPTVLTEPPSPPTDLAVGALEVELQPLQQASFSHTDFTGDAWESTLFGLVEVDTTRSAEENTRCIVLIGVLTPTVINDGTVSSAYSSPDFTVVADGELHSEVAVGCETAELQTLGYRAHRAADVTLGTDFAFYSSWLLPAEAEPVALVVGDPTSPDALYYEPTEITDLITPETSEGSGAQLTEDLEQLTGSEFAFQDFSGDEWSGELAGLVDIPVSRFNDDPGRCVALLGVLSPTGLEDGELSAGFSTPQFSVIINGTLQGRTGSDCDTGGLSSFGYGSPTDANLTEGTSFPFAAAFFVGPDEIISAVVAGNPFEESARYYEPEILPDTPAPSAARVGPLNAEVVAIDSATFEYVDFNEQDIWDVELRGLVDAETTGASGDAQELRCVLLLGALTPTRIGEGTISNPFRAPRVDLVADGRLVTSSSIGCDTDDVEDAGYRAVLDAEVTSGTSFLFFMAFLVPADAELMALSTGDTAGGTATYFEPAELEVLPEP